MPPKRRRDDELVPPRTPHKPRRYIQELPRGPMIPVHPLTHHLPPGVYDDYIYRHRNEVKDADPEYKYVPGLVAVQISRATGLPYEVSEMIADRAYPTMSDIRWGKKHIVGSSWGDRFLDASKVLDKWGNPRNEHGYPPEPKKPLQEHPDEQKRKRDPPRYVEGQEKRAIKHRNKLEVEAGEERVRDFRKRQHADVDALEKRIRRSIDTEKLLEDIRQGRATKTDAPGYKYDQLLGEGRQRRRKRRGGRKIIMKT